MYYLTKVVILFSLFNSRTVTNHCSTQYIFRRAIFRGWCILKDFDLRVRISWVSSTQKTINSTHPSVQHKKIVSSPLNIELFFSDWCISVELTIFSCWTHGFVEQTFFCWSDGFFVLNWRVCWTDAFWGLKRSWTDGCDTEGDPYIENFSKNLWSPYYESPESDILLSKIFGRTQFQIFLRFSRLRVKWFGLE